MFFLIVLDVAFLMIFLNISRFFMNVSLPRPAHKKTVYFAALNFRTPLFSRLCKFSRIPTFSKRKLYSIICTMIYSRMAPDGDWDISWAWWIDSLKITSNSGFQESWRCLNMWILMRVEGLENRNSFTRLQEMQVKNFWGSSGLVRNFENSLGILEISRESKGFLRILPS